MRPFLMPEALGSKRFAVRFYRYGFIHPRGHKGIGIRPSLRAFQGIEFGNNSRTAKTRGSRIMTVYGRHRSCRKQTPLIAQQLQTRYVRGPYGLTFFEGIGYVFSINYIEQVHYSRRIGFA